MTTCELCGEYTDYLKLCIACVREYNKCGDCTKNSPFEAFAFYTDCLIKRNGKCENCGFARNMFKTLFIKSFIVILFIINMQVSYYERNDPDLKPLE